MAHSVAEKIGYLRENQLFQDFSAEEMREMDRRTTMRTCAPGRVFYRAGDRAEALYILKQGVVHLYRLTPDGRKLIVATLSKGAIFGEMAIMGQGMYDTFAEAATEARICIMSRADVEALLLNKPQMALRLLAVIGERLRDAERRLEQLAFASVSSRLAGQLLTLSGGSPSVEGYTHQDLAEMIGTYRETITATLSEFRAQGLVEIGRKQIEILNREGLLALSEHS